MKTVFYLQSSFRLSNIDLLTGAQRAAKALGWNLRIVKCGLASPNHRDSDDLADLAATLHKMQDFWSPIGMIVDCGGLPTQCRKIDLHLPTVFLDCSPKTIGKGAVCVYSDATDIARTVARELLSLNAASYAFVPFTINLPWSVERGRAYAEAIRLHQLPCAIFRKERHEVDDSTYLHELERWLVELPKPAAVFAANDFIGEVVIRCAQRRGISVPDDVAVMGVDNDEEICLRSTPSLSSVRPDHEKAGYLAATLLKDLIRKPRQRPKSLSFGTLAVIHRSSTRKLNRHDERTVKIVEIIRKQALSHVSVEQIAKDFGVTRRLIEMRFREATGHSIRDELQMLRLERAKLLLRQGDLCLSHVATASGYPSVQAFRKTFTAATGVSPLKWRNSRR